MKRMIIGFLVLATLAQGQALKRNQQMFAGSASGIVVGAGASVVTAVGVGTTQGILKRILVQNAGGTAAGTTASFDVRICTYGRSNAGLTNSCNTEGPESLFQKQGVSTLGSYPFGLYAVQDIMWANHDTPVTTNTLYVRIKNNGASSNTFDIYLTGVMTER